MSRRRESLLKEALTNPIPSRVQYVRASRSSVSPSSRQSRPYEDCYQQRVRLRKLLLRQLVIPPMSTTGELTASEPTASELTASGPTASEPTANEPAVASPNPYAVLWYIMM
jgi:hypothetical protein